MKIFAKILVTAMLAAIFIAACGASQPAGTKSYTEAETTAALEKGACGTCHIIPGIPNAAGVIAPDLSNINMMAQDHIKSGSYTGKAKSADEYIRESILDPNIFVAPECPNAPCAANVMPATLKDLLSADETSAIVSYLNGLPNHAYGSSAAAAA
ncbi:MAG: hypothetical protein PHQ36_08995, partial [Anaerolineales bacterium]|nr:hypothetical protein [Anaerolineales bacterium]